jgi:hypothetical protein
MVCVTNNTVPPFRTPDSLYKNNATYNSPGGLATSAGKLIVPFTFSGWVVFLEIYLPPFPPQACLGTGYENHT